MVIDKEESSNTPEKEPEVYYGSQSLREMLDLHKRLNHINFCNSVATLSPKELEKIAIDSHLQWMASQVFLTQYIKDPEVLKRILNE